MQRWSRRQTVRGVGCIASAILLVLTLGMVVPAAGEGSGTIYRGINPVRFRSNLEWRTSNYGGGDSPEFVLRRRTLLKLYAVQGESMLLGSSGIAIGGALDSGDIRVFNPGQVTGLIGQETIPALAGIATPAQAGASANGFSCVAQRATSANATLGRITSRTQELAGPLPAAQGYSPCVYVAPVTGIYDLVFTGPSGATADTNAQISGAIESTANDFGPAQQTSVTAWDVTIRDAGGNNLTGRLFTYYYGGTTGGGGRTLGGESYVVTSSGFRYRLFFDGDPFGFVFYVNQLGFQNSDGTPLYRNVMADPAVATQAQNQLRELQGGVRLLPPQYPIFIANPDPIVLDALGIPRQSIAPAIGSLVFSGIAGSISTGVAAGGTFTFTSTQPGVYSLIVSRDGTNFDPGEPGNRVLRGVAPSAGPVAVAWDGLDNAGVAFPVGEYLAAAAIKGGEVHFPFLDVENNIGGGPQIELTNPPDRTGDGVSDCPPWNGGCFGAFYDDRGYRTANGSVVGTAVNGALCPGDAANPRGFGNPPLVTASDAVNGFDTRTTQRSFGFPVDANPAAICLPNGGFGDKKGLDIWTYYPSNLLQTPLRIVDPSAVTLRSLVAIRTGTQTTVQWETSSERDTLGFHILRSASGARADAVQVTTVMLPAQGTSSQGARYTWVDPTIDERAAYTYWLQEIEMTGSSHDYGPVRPNALPVAAGHTVALPFITR